MKVRHPSVAPLLTVTERRFIHDHPDIITIEDGNLDDGKIMVMILMILTMERMQDVRMIRTSLEGSGR